MVPVDSFEDLIGGVEDLNPPFSVGTNTALITLWHGEPDEVLRPGELIKGLRRRGRGGVQKRSPQGIRVSIEDVVATIEISDIGLRDAYRVPLLVLPFRVRVSARDGFAGLLQYVREHGLNFAQLLEQDVKTELGTMVRRERPNTTREASTKQPQSQTSSGRRPPRSLLNQLFDIVQLDAAEPTWDPALLQVIALEATLTAEAAKLATATAVAPVREKQLELEAAAGQADAEREHTAAAANAARRARLSRDEALARDEIAAEESQRRLDRLAGEARRLGMSLAEYENRDELERQRQLALDRDHELKVKAIEAISLMAGERTNPDLVRGLERIVSPPRLRSLGSGALLPAGDEAEVVDAIEVDDDPLSLASLRSDGALARMWQTAGIPGRPLALGFDDDSHPVTVIVVSGTPIDQGVTTTINQTFARGMGAELVVTIIATRTLADVVRGYFFCRVPALEGLDAQVDVRADGKRLCVSVSSTAGRLGPHLATLADPLFLAPLKGILPFDIIEVALADGRQ
jgi:hypothetical protein